VGGGFGVFFLVVVELVVLVAAEARRRRGETIVDMQLELGVR
jgi:hypothetical protein